MTLTDDAQTILHASEREEWLTVKEFAAIRRVHEQTVYSLIRRGAFTHHVEREGRCIRIYVPRESINTQTRA